MKGKRGEWRGKVEKCFPGNLAHGKFEKSGVGRMP